MNGPKISLIVTTYNRPKALNVVLKSILEQTVMPNEIIIADDGSTDETRVLIEEYAESFPVPLIHSWQEDIGFRLSASRNKAIARSTGDYIVLIDGDMVLDRRYISDHREAMRDGYMYICSRVFLSEIKTQQIEQTATTNVSFWDKGIEKNKLNQIRNSCLLWLFPSIKTYEGAKGYMAFWKKDCITVNGFDERYEGWGREDSDFMIRMINAGIVAKKMKGRCISYHLFHKEADRNKFDENNNLLKDVFNRKIAWCDKGIDQYL